MLFGSARFYPLYRGVTVHRKSKEKARKKIYKSDNKLKKRNLQTEKKILKRNTTENKKKKINK